MTSLLSLGYSSPLNYLNRPPSEDHCLRVPPTSIFCWASHPWLMGANTLYVSSWHHYGVHHPQQERLPTANRITTQWSGRSEIWRRCCTTRGQALFDYEHWWGSHPLSEGQISQLFCSTGWKCGGDKWGFPVRRSEVYMYVNLIIALLLFCEYLLSFILHPSAMIHLCIINRCHPWPFFFLEVLVLPSCVGSQAYLWYFCLIVFQFSTYTSCWMTVQNGTSWCQLDCKKTDPFFSTAKFRHLNMQGKWRLIIRINHNISSP